MPLVAIFQLWDKFTHDDEWYLKAGSGREGERMTTEDLNLPSESLVIPVTDSSQESPNQVCPFFPLCCKLSPLLVKLCQLSNSISHKNLSGFQIIKTERTSSIKYGQIKITNSELQKQNSG